MNVYVEQKCEYCHRHLRIFDSNEFETILQCYKCPVGDEE